MPAGDITTSKQFTNGQLGVDGSDLNAIVGQSSIQPAFYSAQATANSPGSNDQVLILTQAGSFARITIPNFFTNQGAMRSGIGLLGQANVLLNGDMSIWQRAGNGAAGAAVFNSVGISGGSLYTADRWRCDSVAATGRVNITQLDLAGSLAGGPFNYRPRYGLRATVAVSQASLLATEYFKIAQRVELNVARQLFDNPSSFSIWVRTSVAGTYSLFIRDSSGAVYFKQDFSIASANTWTRLVLQNIPSMPTGSGNWGTNETDYSYEIGICLAGGTNFQSSVMSTWTTSGGFFCSSLQTNLLATGGATFDMCLAQHEPGTVCTTFQQLPFADQIYYCSRYTSVLRSYYLGLAKDTQLLYDGRAEFKNPMRVPPAIEAIAGNGTDAAAFTVGGGNAGTVALGAPTSQNTEIFNNAANWTANVTVRVVAVLQSEL